MLNVLLSRISQAVLRVTCGYVTSLGFRLSFESLHDCVGVYDSHLGNLILDAFGVTDRPEVRVAHNFANIEVLIAFVPILTLV